MPFTVNKNHRKHMKKNLSKPIKKLKSKIRNSRLLDQTLSSISINKIKDKYKKKLLSFSILKYKDSLQNINPKKLYSFVEYLQDKVNSISKTDSNKVILKQSDFWPRAITWVLMGSTAFAVGWVSIAKTDEVVIATGKLEPKGGVINVQMPLEGITSEVLVKEGEIVEKGQLLIRLDTEVTKNQSDSLQKNLEFNELILNKLSVLVKEGAVSELQYLEQKSKIEDIKSRIKTNMVKLRYQDIVSPAKGIVFDLQPKGPGFVARTSEPVLQIVPFNNLLAKVEIESRTIGFVETGKKVDISIDSFPSTDFGVIKGTVKSLGSDALEPVPSQGKGYRFPTIITLDEQFLKLKSGKKLELQAGMSLTANIKLRKVTYLQLLLNKFTDKADSLKSI